MPKFLVQAKYTTQGTAGLLETSASARRQTAERGHQLLDGKLEAFYFSFGQARQQHERRRAAAVALHVDGSRIERGARRRGERTENDACDQ